MSKKFKVNILGSILSFILNVLVLIILALIIFNVTTTAFDFGRDYMQEELEYEYEIT